VPLELGVVKWVSMAINFWHNFSQNWQEFMDIDFEFNVCYMKAWADCAAAGNDLMIRKLKGIGNIPAM
jgi:hypothetical protein